jgi:peptide/nickel transport system substrate-binding protein/oligopeptide transport system substrate-binding protein
MRITTALLLLPLAAATAQNGGDTLVINFLPSDLNFNPLITYTTSEAQIYTGLYEGLVSYDPFSLDPIPAVAERWEVIDDGLRYRFYLREDARYSNGDPVLASHFKDTWLRLLAPATDAAYASLFDVVEGAAAFRRGEERDPDSVGIRVAGPRILEIQLERRATHLLRILCHHSFVVIHPDMLDGGDFSDPTAIPYNGPFRVSELSGPESAGGRMILEPNAEYWDRRRIELDAVEIRFNDDATTVTEAFNEGEIHWVRGGIDFDTATRPEELVVNPLFATTYYQLTAHKAPFDDARIRQAFALALPWEAIRDPEVWFVPANTLVPSLPSYPVADGIVEQDLERARQLLEEAGYPNGEGLPEITISTPFAVENDFVAEQMIIAWEEELGATVRAETIPYPRYFEYIEEEQFMVSTISWIGDFADPLTFLDMWTTGSNLNNSRYTNSAYDELIAEASGLTGDERYEMLSEAEAIILNDGIVLPVSHSPSINLINRELVDGWYANPLDIHPLKYLQFAAGGPIPYFAAK